MNLKVKMLNPEAKLPVYATDGATSMDLFYCGMDFTLRPGDSVICNTGIAIEIPYGYMGLVHSRSGMGFKYDVTLANSIGDLDSDYRGEVLVKLINHSDLSVEIECGDRIAQLAIVPIVRANPIEVEELSNTKRGSNGFGSTGE